MDAREMSAKAEIGSLRTEMKELELRLRTNMLECESRLAWMWVVAIYAASLALGVAILGALMA